MLRTLGRTLARRRRCLHECLLGSDLQSRVIVLGEGQRQFSGMELQFSGTTQDAFTEEETLKLREEARALRGRTHGLIKDPNVSKEEKHHLLAVMHIENARSLLLCRTCWLTPEFCLCSRWKQVTLRHEVCVYMHHNEWGRGINSGVILATAAGCKIYITGHRDHEAELQKIFDDSPDLVAILWPPNPQGEDGVPPISVDELCESHADLVGKGLKIVLLDATWKNARSMVKRLPKHLRRVYIPADAMTASGPALAPTSLLRPVRKYKGEDGRISSLEAVVGFLRCVGEPPEVCDALLENLKLKVDAILQQKGKKPSVYGNQVGRTTKQIAEDKAVRRAERIKEKYGDNPPPLSAAPDSGGDVHNAA